MLVSRSILRLSSESGTHKYFPPMKWNAISPFRSFKLFSANVLLFRHCCFAQKRFTSTNIATDITTVTSIITRPKLIKLRKHLENEQRFRISVNEYLQLCNSFGISEEEGRKFANVLDKATIIVKLDQSPNFIYLKPERLSKHMLDVLHPELTENQRLIQRYNEELRTLNTEKEALDKIKSQLDRKAEQRASLIMWSLLGGMVAQVSIIARLTWWELSWDIMEPITYILTYTQSIFAFTYFALRKREYSYEGVYETMAEKRRRKFYLKYQFDIHHYQNINERILKLENDLLSLGAQYHLPPHKDLKAINIDATE